MIDVSIIIAGTNEKSFIEKCLNSIYESKCDYSKEIILVDNASIDGTSEMVLRDYKDVKLIRNKKKMGYIYNNNMAMKTASGRYILVINADIEFNKDTLQIMLDFMEQHPEAGVSACKLTFNDGTLQLSCRRFPTLFTYLHRMPHFFRWLSIGKKFASSNIVHKYLMMDYDHEKIREVNWMLSAFFLMRKAAIDDIGMFDEKLFQPFYLEDMDWCFRAHKNEWKVYYVPDAVAIHHYQRDSVKKFGWLSIVHMLNIIVFYSKHGLAMLRGKHEAWS